MTGLGAYRRLVQAGTDIKYFIDSDPALWGLTIFNKSVISPEQARDRYDKNLFDLIIITAVLKAPDVRSTIGRIFIDSGPPEILEYGAAESPSYTIDILGTCNLSCGSCPHSIENHGVPKGSMTVETYEKVLSKAIKETPTLTHISLYSWGDPLLHPKIADIIDLAHEKGLAVAVSSNLSMNLDNRLDAIVESAPDYFKISVSGFTQDVYSSTHQGGDINLVKSNLYRLRYLMNKKQKSFLVDINYHLYKNNYGYELANFKKLADDLGFALSETYSLVMPLERVLDYYAGSPDFNTRTLNDSQLLVTIEEGVEVSGGRQLGTRDCTFRANQVNINADLTVPLCCLTFERSERTIVSQNYLNSDLADINQAKREKSICEKCQSLGLPEYNLGFNSDEWKKIADRKKG